MWPFKRQKICGFDSWPIVRSKPIGKTYGRSISIFINNMQCHLTTVDVYEDGSVECWGFVDLDLFGAKLKERWVVPGPKSGQTISVFNFGFSRVENGTWFQTPRSIANEVNSIVRSLNPELHNLIDMKGSDTEACGKIRRAKMMISDKKPYRKSESTGVDILADHVPVLRATEVGFDLTNLFVFADGLLRIGSSGELFPIKDLASAYTQGKIANVAPENSLITLPGLGEFRAANKFGGVSVHDRIGEVNDMYSQLKGEPGVIALCIKRFGEYEQQQSPAAKEALHEAYNAVPEHLRCYCGDMDTRDTEIRAVLYGEQAEY